MHFVKKRKEMKNGLPAGLKQLAAVKPDGCLLLGFEIDRLIVS